MHNKLNIRQRRQPRHYLHQNRRITDDRRRHRHRILLIADSHLAADEPHHRHNYATGCWASKIGVRSPEKTAGMPAIHGQPFGSRYCLFACFWHCDWQKVISISLPLAVAIIICSYRYRWRRSHCPERHVDVEYIRRHLHLIIFDASALERAFMPERACHFSAAKASMIYQT